MNRILRALGVDDDCKIAVLQYERDGRGVGKEEELHWSIMVQTDPQPNDESRFPCFQAYDRTYNDERGKQWQLYDKDVSLFTTRKCLGGVYIGSIKRGQLKLLREVVHTNPPTNRPAEWNCRDWVMEVIQLFAQKEWLYASIPAQSTLLPSLRRASVATMSAYAESTRVFPAIVEFAP